MIGGSLRMVVLATVLQVPIVIDAQTNDSSKRATATRVVGAIRMDGRLDEVTWQGARFLSDFRQKEPVENGEPGDRTEVAFQYDDRALYVGARMLSRDPKAIPRDITRRDQYGNSEHIVISLDPYLDRRTSYSFSITSGGVRRDYYNAGDDDRFSNRDFTYDPVWDGKVSLDSTGWTAEIRIPFSQLRFAKKSVQEWGLNVLRWIPTRNEDIYWVVVPRNEAGFASRFGTLAGIEGIKPSRRVEVVPYLAGNGRFDGRPNAANLLDPRGRETQARAGADLKMGLGPNLTVDATINPDFGQVEADPAEVNLTAFETIFDERRPFFTEGSQLLRSTVANYFYSRRIGGSPRGDATGDFVTRPSNTTILGAAKITGRLANGLSIGGLAAVTDRESARTFDTLPGTFGRTQVEPRAGYGVIRLQQQFGRDASTIGMIISGVSRGLAGDSALAARLSNRAVAGGVDWLLRFQQGRYEISGDIGGSYLDGSALAVARVQGSPAHYFQRPDYRQTDLDPTARSLKGWRARLRGDKNAGNWLWGAEMAVESPGFETNDMGRLNGADDIDWIADITHRWTIPGRWFRAATVGVSTRGNLNFDGVRTNTGFSFFTSQTWRNFISSFFNVNCQLRAQSDILTRGGPLMATPAGCEVNGGLNSSFANATSWHLFANRFATEAGDWQFRLAGGFTVRPTSALSLSLDPNYSQSSDTRQYVGQVSGGSSATFGQRYLFGTIRRSTFVLQTRINYTFSPNVTVEVYAEPFAASGKYSRIGELSAARSRALRLYGTEGTAVVPAPDGTGFTVTDANNGQTFGVGSPDFNLLSFRSNVVFRWEWRPGSTLFLVWQQSRSTRCVPGDLGGCPGALRPGSLVGPRSLRESLGVPGDNFIAVKVSYWLPVN